MPTVLVTDDELDHRELLTMVLRRLGHDVVTAADGAGALALLGGGGVDLVLTDVRMPGESGIELCRAVREDPGFGDVPVMVVSADVNRRQVVAALHAGADDFLPKPFSRAELARRVDGLLRRGGAGVVAVRSAGASRAALAAAFQAVPVWQEECGRRIA